MHGKGSAESGESLAQTQRFGGSCELAKTRELGNDPDACRGTVGLTQRLTQAMVTNNKVNKDRDLQAENKVRL